MDTPPFDPAPITHAIRDALTVQRVFGDAYERDGALVIPVAKLWGATGSGGGSGSGDLGAGRGHDNGPDPDASSDATPRTPFGEGSGGGGGFGLKIKPLGAYVVDAAGTRWLPALDLNRIILGGQVMAVLVAGVVGWTIGRRRRR